MNLLAQLAETRPPTSSVADQAAGVGTVAELNTLALEIAAGRTGVPRSLASVPAQAASPMIQFCTNRKVAMVSSVPAWISGWA